MARTILGLVNWTDGKVYFGNPPCDTRIACIAEDVEGCIEWTGEHAGQVKVTITQAEDEDCNDTYYGCVNWATKKFQITIPDDCCEEPFCPCEGGQQEECGANFLKVTFTGVAGCQGLDVSSLNQCLCLEYRSSGCDVNFSHGFCWSGGIVLGGVMWEIIYGPGTVAEEGLHLVVWRYIESGYQFVFYKSVPGDTGCTKGPFHNTLNCSQSHYWGIYGSAIIENPCDPSICDGAAAWLFEHEYNIGNKVEGTNSNCYICKVAHTSAETDRPGSGVNWTLYWYLTC